MIIEDFNIEFHYNDGDIGVHALIDSEDDFTIEELIKEWSSHKELSHIVIRPKLLT